MMDSTHVPTPLGVFGKLPPEVRVRIWKYVLPESLPPDKRCLDKEPPKDWPTRPRLCIL